MFSGSEKKPVCSLFLHRLVDRSDFHPGAVLKGPAIIEERESTIVIGEDATATVDSYGFVWIDL